MTNEGQGMVKAPLNTPLTALSIWQEAALTGMASEVALDAVLHDISLRPTDPSDPDSLLTPEGEERMPLNELVEATWQFMQDTLGAAGQHLDKARENHAAVHIKVGRRLFDIFFNATKELVEGENLNPYKARAASWKSLMAKIKGEHFLKSSAIRNMLGCAVQAQWFDSEKVDITGLTYTHLVLLSRLENGEKKKQLIADIKREGWSSRKLHDLMPRPRVEPPAPIGESLTNASTWIDQYKDDDNFLEDITSIHELSPAKAEERLGQVNELIPHLEAALERLRVAQKELVKAANSRS